MLLGELLLSKGLLTRAQLEEALEEQKSTREFLGEILLRKKFIREDNFLMLLSKQFNIPYVRLRDQSIDWDSAMRFPASLIMDHRCLPLRFENGRWIVAITNPLDAETVSEAERAANSERVDLVLVTSGDMEDALKEYQKRVADKIKKMF